MSYKKDQIIFDLIEKEQIRQENVIEMIASENIVSKQVQEACGSILTNKYAEGYPSKRYYAGCGEIDKIEALAIERAKELFECKFANVQPHSGASANLAVLFACCEYFKCKPQDLKVLGMSLDAGGHLTHGARPTISGKWFKSYNYGLDESFLIDYDFIEKEIEDYSSLPKDVKKGFVVILGGSAYTRDIDYKRIRNKINSLQKLDKEILLFVDMAHFAGLVAGKQLENPCKYADIVSTTTHKTLRGPRGGMILSNDESIAKFIDKAIFPGCQGGPLEHIIAGKAVSFYEALQPEFKEYSKQVILNNKAFCDKLKEEDVNLVSDRSDNHICLVDLKSYGVSGSEMEDLLTEVGIICNKNSVFGDKSPMNPNGIRLGTPACTTRGFKEEDMVLIANIISRLIKAKSKESLDDKLIKESKDLVSELCKKYPHF
ncbi:MAG: serine hydroxymethyltransferase [Alphaproteobacteria bacterium]|jgi:glycine hydroxymethyltransferase|nr:serine hydroxymethyltransferase [Alphaproteobacteria bacterium]